MKKLIQKILARLGYGLYRIRSKNLNQSTDNSFFLNGKVDSPYNNVPFAGETLKYFIDNFKFKSVLDIGSGEGRHSDVFHLMGKHVTSIDFGNSIYFKKRKDNHTCITGDYYKYKFDRPFDAIWASHVLEHQPNPNLFLRKIFNDLKEGGVLCITVPPLKHEIVGGHVTLWNAGLLLYQMVLAGFNCSEVSIKSYGYNVSVILIKKSIKKYPELSYDSGDIIKLKSYFPERFNEPFNGNILEHNWNK